MAINFLIDSNVEGTLTVSGGDIIMSTTKALYFDGGGGTYIYESADGVMDFYCDTKQLLTLKQNGTQNEVIVNEGSIDVDFRLDSSVLSQLQRAASVYQLPDLCLYGDGTDIQLRVTDKKNDSSNSFSVSVGETSNEFCYCFKVENLKLLPGSYQVSVSKTNVALFQGDGIKYFIALEPNT